MVWVGKNLKDHPVPRCTCGFTLEAGTTLSQVMPYTIATTMALFADLVQISEEICNLHFSCLISFDFRKFLKVPVACIYLPTVAVENAFGNITELGKASCNTVCKMAGLLYFSLL